MWQDGEGGCVQPGQSVAQVLVCKLVCVCGALEIGLVLVEGDVVAVGARLLVLEGFAAALVALVVDLQFVSANSETMHRRTHLGIFPLLDGLLHWLQRVSCQLCGYDQFPVDVLDLLHHVRLQLGKGVLQRGDALEGGMRCLDSDMRATRTLLAAQWLVEGVEVFDGGQLVVEDVGPRVTPLLRRRLELGAGQLSPPAC